MSRLYSSIRVFQRGSSTKMWRTIRRIKPEKKVVSEKTYSGTCDVGKWSPQLEHGACYSIAGTFDALNWVMSRVKYCMYQTESGARTSIGSDQ